MANLGIGIIGCGNISTSYLRLAPLFKGLKVRAVADLNPDAAKARGKEFDVKAQSVEDLLANPEVDVVINLTIPDAHFGVTKRILEAGKHRRACMTACSRRRARSSRSRTCARRDTYTR